MKEKERKNTRQHAFASCSLTIERFRWLKKVLPRVRVKSVQRKQSLHLKESRVIGKEKIFTNKDSGGKVFLYFFADNDKVADNFKSKLNFDRFGCVRILI